MCRVLVETLVGPREPFCEDVIELSILDQQAVRIYSGSVIAFRLQPDQNIHSAIHHLKKGLQGALTEIPDFAARVVAKPDSTRGELELRLGLDSGAMFKIVDHSPSCGADCHELLKGHSFAQLEEEHFALTKIPERVLLFPHPTAEDELPDGAPGVLVQVNIVEGGLLLGFAWHHTIADGRGADNFLGAWAKATNSSYSQNDTENQDDNAEEQFNDRWRLSTAIPGATITDFSDYSIDASVRRSKYPGKPHLVDNKYPIPADCVVSVWQLHPEAMQALLTAVHDEPTLKSAEQRFTQAEVLSALMWKHVSLARGLHETLPAGSSLLTTRIDFRRRLNPPLPQSFIGNMNQPVVRYRVPVQTLCAPSTPASLMLLARGIREAVAANDEGTMRLLVGLIDTLPNVTDLVVKFNTCPGPDMAITDLSGLDMLHYDWGNGLGQAVSMRVFARYRGFASFLPRQLDGSYQVAVQCESRAVERLRADPAFGQYAQYLYSGPYGGS